MAGSGRGFGRSPRCCYGSGKQENRLTIYRICRADQSDDEAYWISARSEGEARRLVALNARNARYARGNGFICERDASEMPAPDTIHRRKHGPIPIAKR